MDSTDILVMKFGGTSVGTPQAMAQAAAIVKDTLPTWPRQVVVTSALSGVTDLLLEQARRASQGDTSRLDTAAQDLQARHAAILEALVADAPLRQAALEQVTALVGEFLSLCRAIGVLGEATPRALDAVASLGERMSVRVLSAVLAAVGVPAPFVDATRLILTDDDHQAAHPDLDETRRRTREQLLPLLDAGQTPVVTGFIAATRLGAITTLGRGGSDYSAAILAEALAAREVWIWTDVDGVMTADPRLVPDACTIPELNYREVAELAYFGAKVLHPKTIRPVVEAGIGLRVCNTFNPSHPGTCIVTDRDARRNGVIKAVTAIRDLTLVTLEGRGMLGVPGVAARTFGTVASTGTSVPLITQASSEQSICFAVPAAAAEKVIAALERSFAQEIANRDIDRVWATGQVDIVSAVGAGMIHTPGVAGRVFTALGVQGVNVIAIAQGSSEVSISLVVDAADTKAAVNALHALIIK
jgi:aspartate kinase